MKRKILLTSLLSTMIVFSITACSGSSNSLSEIEDSSVSVVATETKTEKSTEVSTEPPTEEPTEKPTEPPTEEPTEEPTEPPTEKPTEAPTEPPTEPPTERITTVVYDIPEQQTTDYVLNTSTMKVHRGNCSQVSRISPENYATTTDLEWAFNNGYTACGKCNP